ncbi:MAG TPA: hypothetical protein V6C81_22090 [Planktothrix sp.]|jgi:hypothetical protein
MSPIPTAEDIRHWNRQEIEARQKAITEEQARLKILEQERLDAETAARVRQRLIDLSNLTHMLLEQQTRLRPEPTRVEVYATPRQRPASDTRPSSHMSSFSRPF